MEYQVRHVPQKQSPFVITRCTIFFNIVGGVAGNGGGRRKSLFLFIGLISYRPSPLVLLFLGHMALAASFSSAIDHCHLICSSFLYRYLLTSYRSIVGAVENNLRSLISSINLSSHRSLISSIDWLIIGGRCPCTYNPPSLVDPVIVGHRLFLCVILVKFVVVS